MQQMKLILKHLIYIIFLKDENNCIYNEVSGNLKVDMINISNNVSVDANFYVPKSSSLYLAIYDIVKIEEGYEFLQRSMYFTSFSTLELTSANSAIDSLSYNLTISAIDGVSEAILKEYNENDECIKRTPINYQASGYELVLSQETSYYVIEEKTTNSRNLHIFNKEANEVNYTIMFIIDERITPMIIKIK